MENCINSEENENERSSPVEKEEDPEKIEVQFKPIANAPILKMKKWKVDKDKRIGQINMFVRRVLKIDPADSLIFYINQTFAPSPDQTMRNLYDCYATDGVLILHYSITQAWG